MKNQDSYINTGLRLPRDLHAAISEMAMNSGRSMNSQIINNLMKSAKPYLRQLADSATEFQGDSSGSSAKFVGDFLSLPIDEETDKARLELMFSMHREFMRRYEDLVQDRDHWQALAESKK